MTDHRRPPFFHEIFHISLPRLGPGNAAMTTRALDIALRSGHHLDDSARILDIGCGTGAPTLQIAQRTAGAITAVDDYQPHLDELTRRARKAGLGDRIHTRCMDMAQLSEEDQRFDLIWAEGSLSLMGFAEGLAMCQRLLVPGGRAGVSDLCWLRPDPPAECRAFFDVVFPAMMDVESNLRLIRDAGLEVIEHFPLPETCWLDSLYAPLEERVKELRGCNRDDAERIQLLDSIQGQIDLYRRYPGSYGYEFFVMRRP